MAEALSITIEGWEKIVAKYGATTAKKALGEALNETTIYTADLVRRKVAGKHHVTGFLASSITGSISTSHEGKTFAKMGGGVYYAPFVERGTGIYGPRHAPIVPTHAKRLAWHPKTVTGKKTGSGMIVRRSVKGQPPVQMFHKTFTEDKAQIAARFNKAFKSRFLGA